MTTLETITTKKLIITKEKKSNPKDRKNCRGYFDVLVLVVIAPPSVCCISPPL